ncbi:Signal peptide protein [Ralstonia mannitolilytica]|nr:hypothetical protein [Ralstonia mannitolilytica]ANA35771.1 hypothetical protein VZ52_20485 [Ralstonia mannitolilytica]CAJ0686930.1 hypothetical protein R82526_02895 [Ralstonia mannitolilytica]CAJ0804472.1 hypothetical protein R77555_04129 [Ralstonia mannitolilytica]CAJ0856071.1 hypothetical protein R76727_01040 [Ralstonia mannitolilytica]
MKTMSKLAFVSILAAASMMTSFAASAAMQTGSTVENARTHSARDPYTDGARISQRDPYTDGGFSSQRDPYTSGQAAGQRDVYTDGASSSSRDKFNSGL